jgi:GTPase SAR1 family protein
MPLPLVPIFIAFAVGAVASGSVVSNWENIVYSLKGKKIAVLGARKVGKTTLLKYMEKGILIERYNQTVNKEDIQRKRIKLGDLDIILKKTVDVPGGTDQYDVWENLFEGSDLVLYLVRTDMLLKHDSETEKRTEDDLQQIHCWIKKFGSTQRKQLFIVGNHWDSDPVYKNLTPDQKGNYQSQFTSLPIVKKMILLAGGAATVKVALGSLANENDADYLIQTIFKQVEK